MSCKGPAITNNTVKLLKYIHRHQNCTFSDLQRKFKDLDFMELVNLCLTEYMICTKPDNRMTVFRDGNFSVGENDRFWVSPKTEQFLQERRRAWLQWVIPTAISGVALILSILAFIMSLMPKVTEVRILP
ncbi:hypothetical protein [Anaeromassilibacillus sp. An200]|uniref:hypothetical protein n=1 Tax=Anaeromassilibacillus sp. An200 TaxID=1965587 RepID=UPI000B3768DD|nr:hypothetical protein [Anaeromassilibacillus sp. An200]